MVLLVCGKIVYDLVATPADIFGLSILVAGP